MGNTAPSGAADVAVAILTAQSTAIHLNGGTLLDPGAALPAAAGAPGPITLNYLAAYKSPAQRLPRSCYRRCRLRDFLFLIIRNNCFICD